MKLLISTFILLFSNFTWAQEVCVDFKTAGWSQNKFKALPDGSILITNPYYVFNGETYYVNGHPDSAKGLCRVFGRNLIIHTIVEKSTNTISLTETGEIENAYPWYIIIGSIQCK